jgi:putative ABC transport system substrate-binding protein
MLALALAVPQASVAQAPGQVPRVGVIRHLRPTEDVALAAFRQGLRELGYVEGQTLRLEVRYTDERRERLTEALAELIRLPVDVLVVHGSAGVETAKALTTTIPIVMARIDDAVTQGYVASLARPGGNLTGLSFQTEELSSKWVELLQEALPRLSRVAVLAPVEARHQLRTLAHTTQALGLHLQILEVRTPDDFEGAFAAAHTAQAEGLVLLGSLVVTAHVPQLAALAATYRLPAIYYHRRFAEAGGLLAYGPKESDPRWGYRRAAHYVDKILKGATPAELPIEQPTQFELVINLKTAQALGLTLPPRFLFLADEVIQ